MNKKIKLVWNYLNGKKTFIGTLLMFSAEVIRAYVPNLMTTDQIEIISMAGAILGGVGLSHKAAKSNLTSKISQNLTFRKKH